MAFFPSVLVKHSATFCILSLDSCKAMHKVSNVADLYDVMK